jgi:hypothetical protein
MAWISSNASADFFMHDAIKSAAELGKTRELAREMARGCAREQGRFRVRLKSFLAEVAALNKHGCRYGIVHLFLTEVLGCSLGIRKITLYLFNQEYSAFFNLTVAHFGRVGRRR